MSDDFSIYQYYQFESIEGKLRKTDVAFERKVRRWFAKELSQPINETFKTPWTDIIAHYYDTKIDENDFNTIYDMAIENYVPEMLKEQEEEDQAYADSLIEEQRLSMEKSKKKKEEVIPKKEDVDMSFDMENPDSE